MDLWEHNLTGAIILATGIAGTLINGFVIYGIYEKYKNSENSINSLVVNLSFSNLGIIFFAFPLPIAASFKHHWFWGDAWCSYYGSIALLFGFNIMISMLMLVMDVYLQFNYASYDLYQSKARKLMIAWTWINAIFWSAAPLLGWSRISYEPTNTSCTVDIMNPDTGYVSYIISSFICCYLLPIMLMICGRLKPNKDYTIMVKELNKSSKKIATIILLFIFEWTPYCIVYIWPIFDDPKNIPLKLVAVAPVIAKLSVVLTPFVYFKEYYPISNNKMN